MRKIYVNGINVTKCKNITHYGGCCAKKHFELCILHDCEFKKKERFKQDLLIIFLKLLVTIILVSFVCSLLAITGLIHKWIVVFNAGFFIGLILDDFISFIDSKFRK